MDAVDTVTNIASWAPIVGAALGAAVAAFFGYKKGHSTKPEYEPVLASATLSDGPLIRRLIGAVEDNTESTKDLTETLREQNISREVEHRVERELERERHAKLVAQLRERGIELEF